MDLVLDGAGRRTRRMGRVLDPLAEHYDLAILDCPPSISWSESVFDAADALLVPLIPSTLTVRTFEQLSAFVEDEVEDPPEVVAFFSMVDGRKRLHREVVERLSPDATTWPRPPSPPPPRSSSWASSGRRSSCTRPAAGRRGPTRRSGTRCGRASPSDACRAPAQDPEGSASRSRSRLAEFMQ